MGVSAGAAQGDGVEQDLAGAAALFQVAGTRGHAQAQFNAGVMFQRGEGVEADRERAAAWWAQASEQGHSLAQLELGRHHEALAEEALAAPAALRERMALHALLSREVFDQHVMIAQADAGLGARSAPTEMAPALFLRVLARFLLLVPALVSRDEVLACIERVRLRHQWPGGKGGMSFEQFQAFLEEVLRRAGLPLPDDLDARLAAARAGGPPRHQRQLAPDRDGPAIYRFLNPNFCQFARDMP